MEKIFTSDRVWMTCVDPWLEHVRSLSIISEVRKRITNPITEQDWRDVKQISRIMDQNYRYVRYRYPGQDLDTSQPITREDISAFEVEKTLDIRSSSLCRKLYFLPEDDISEDLLSVDGRVRYAEILNVSSVRSDPCITRFPWRRAKCLCYTIKCIVFFAVLVWEVENIYFKYVWFGSKIAGQMIFVKDYQDNIILKKYWNDSIVGLVTRRTIHYLITQSWWNDTTDDIHRKNIVHTSRFFILSEKHVFHIFQWSHDRFLTHIIRYQYQDIKKWNKRVWLYVIRKKRHIWSIRIVNKEIHLIFDRVHYHT